MNSSARAQTGRAASTKNMATTGVRFSMVRLCGSGAGWQSETTRHKGLVASCRTLSRDDVGVSPCRKSVVQGKARRVRGRGKWTITFAQLIGCRYTGFPESRQMETQADPVFELSGTLTRGD